MLSPRKNKNSKSKSTRKASKNFSRLTKSKSSNPKDAIDRREESLDQINYVFPRITVHSNFNEAKSFHDGDAIQYSLSRNPMVTGLDLLVQAKRNLIVGEPGMGKTSLLGKIDEHLNQIGYRTKLISLRNPDALQQMHEYEEDESQSSALLLDALDEIRAKDYPSVLKAIERVSIVHPDLSIFISSRWSFMSRNSNHFPEYRYIALSPFNDDQVKDYLVRKGHDVDKVTELIERMRSFGREQNILQVPRYLSFLNNYLETNKNDIVAASRLSRNELFEYFIYANLKVEDNKSNKDLSAITKRLLEKLALTMEIYQTNVITKDDLMTFFDEIRSDLKVVALAHMDLRTLFDRTMLKTGEDSIEFDNSEIQEYLAAKELSRLSDPSRAAFHLVVDHHIQDIFPTWYNSLSFLVEFHIDLLEQLVEFSGIRTSEFKVFDEGLLSFITKTKPTQLRPEASQRIFTDVIEYYRKIPMWISWDVCANLAKFYDSSLEKLLIDTAAGVSNPATVKEYVPIGNAIRILSCLLENKVDVNREFWRTRLIELATLDIENNVLQRSALYALELFNDSSVISELPNLSHSEELVARAFLSLCTNAAPDHPSSVDYFISAVRGNRVDGRYGLYKITGRNSIEKVLHTFNDDKIFREQFLDQGRIFDAGEDLQLVNNIEKVFDGSMIGMITDVIRNSILNNLDHNTIRSKFTVGLMSLLKKHVPNFLGKLIGEQYDDKNKTQGMLYLMDDIVADVLEEEDIPVFLDTMLELGERRWTFRVMQNVKYSKRANAQKLFEMGRTKLLNEYQNAEQQTRAAVLSQSYQVLEEFRRMLEPETDKFNAQIFQFFNKHLNELKPTLSGEDENKLKALVTDTVFKFIDPRKTSLSIKQENTTSNIIFSTNIPLLLSATQAAVHLNVDISSYRSSIIGLIPFAFPEDLKVIFYLLGTMTPQEAATLFEVYRTKDSDVWRYQPLSFISMVETYHIKEASEILSGMINEPAYDQYIRRRALIVFDLISPSEDYLQNIFEKYSGSDSERNSELIITANTLLIKSYAKKQAICWRIEEVIRMGNEYVSSTAENPVTALENEIWDRSFAAPLMELSRPGFENNYLALLDEAVRIWKEKENLNNYSSYLWDIVYRYFDNLKAERGYEPLNKLENKLKEIKDLDGANWLAARMSELRRSYLSYIGRPSNISEAIKKYNFVREFENNKIQNSQDLFQLVHDALDLELRHWIEGEGAYELIVGEKVFDKDKQNYEELIQKTLKAQVENILFRRGFQIDLIREPQTLDDKRVDILLRYGFAGPIIVEIKLTSNTDLKTSKLDTTKSFDRMRQYMNAYSAKHGIFLVIDNINIDSTKLLNIQNTFQSIPGVKVQRFTCYKATT